MNKLAFTFLSCSLLNCAFALDVTKAKNSFMWHDNAIKQRISCIEKGELKSKFNKEKDKSAPIARLIALTRLGLSQNATLQSLGINGLDNTYIDLMRAKDINALANIIRVDKIKTWNINDENDAKKLNTFFGFACAMNARTHNKTFSRTDIDATVDQTISTLELDKLNIYKSTIKQNLWNAFNSWEIHALDHVLREEKNGVKNSKALTNAGNSCFFNASMQAVYACKPLRDFITTDLKYSEDAFVVAIRNFLDAMSRGSDAVQTGSRGKTGSGLAYNVLKHIKKSPENTNLGKETSQEDSSEFLGNMIDKIHDAVQNDEKLKNKFENLIYSGAYSAMTVHCNKKCRSKKKEPNNSIILVEIPKDSNVQKLFANKLEEKDEIDSYQCQKCNVLVGATKTTYITNPSKILPISLNRFTQDSYGKLTKHAKEITPNQILHVYDYINRKSYKYILNSVSVHSGSLSGGHYYACQRAGNTWWKKDDQAATQLGNDISDDAKNGYVFFYERLDEATL